MTISPITVQNNLENLTNIFSIHVGYVCGAEKILKVDNMTNSNNPSNTNTE